MLLLVEVPLAELPLVLVLGTNRAFRAGDAQDEGYGDSLISLVVEEERENESKEGSNVDRVASDWAS